MSDAVAFHRRRLPAFYDASVTKLAGRLRVVMIIIDAMPHRHVGPQLTPNLWRQATDGGRAPMGALSLPVSVTYANHAAFITGADPATTGVHGNHSWDDELGWVKAPKAGPRAPTLFDRVHTSDRRSVMIAGDQKLVGQMGGLRADHVWPPNGRLTGDTERCEFGYASDAAVIAAVQAADLDADFVLVHLNQPDTTSHLYGPDSPEALEQYRATDAAYAAVIDQLAAGWAETIVFTLSDHDQESIIDLEPVELVDALAGLDGVDVVHEGTAALIHLAAQYRPSEERLLSSIRSVPGVESAVPLTSDVWMAWTEPGRSFGATPIPIHGQHGSPRCRTQLAIVSGGNERTGAIARRIERHRPSVLDWAPMISDLLGVAGER